MVMISSMRHLSWIGYRHPQAVIRRFRQKVLDFLHCLHFYPVEKVLLHSIHSDYITAIRLFYYGPNIFNSLLKIISFAQNFSPSLFFKSHYLNIYFFNLHDVSPEMGNLQNMYFLSIIFSWELVGGKRYPLVNRKT